MKVLVIAAHTDDEVLGVGGTIARHGLEGDEVYLLSVCDRATNHKYDMDVIKALRNSALKAKEILGIKEIYFCGKKDELITVPEAIVAMEDYTDKIKPDIIYTHHRGDSNQDHRTIFQATVVVSRTIKGPMVKRVLCYEVPSSTEQGPPFLEYAFIPNVFVDIHHVLEKKLEAMKAYETEIKGFPHPRSLEFLTLNARYWGSKVGLEAAEAFVLVREIR